MGKFQINDLQVIHLSVSTHLMRTLGYDVHSHIIKPTLCKLVEREVFDKRTWVDNSVQNDSLEDHSL